MPLPKPSPNETVVITGASSGIGVELAKNLAERGYNLTLVARRIDRLEALANELEEARGIEARAIATDLADATARVGLVAELEQGPAVAGLCNNAGFGIFGRLDGNDPESERERVEVNVVAVHDLTVRLLPGMVERGAGAVLNTASTAGFQPLPGMATYSASKAFVLTFSEALSADLSNSGVSCTALCPGPVRTEFSEVAGNAGLEDSMPSFTVVDASEVARQAVDGMLKGSRTVIPGIANRATAIGGRLAPRSLVLPIAARFTKR